MARKSGAATRGALLEPLSVLWLRQSMYSKDLERKGGCFSSRIRHTVGKNAMAEVLARDHNASRKLSNNAYYHPSLIAEMQENERYVIVSLVSRESRLGPPQARLPRISVPIRICSTRIESQLERLDRFWM